MAGHSKSVVVIGALVAFAASPPAIAGSGNTLYLSQQGTSNTIQVDQSNANDSTVGGVAQPLPVTGDDLTPSSLNGSASQNGFNNSAEITMTGAGGTAGLSQDNSAQPGYGNTATLALSAGALGLVGQLGDHNSAALTVSGVDAFGGIVQNGSNNTGKLDVRGDGVTGKLIQTGSDNHAGFAFSGSSGSQATYEVVGSGVTLTTPATVTTIGNGASVTIVQSTQ
jgi:hypothetical protein